MIKLYADIESHNVILELWGGSTKHPDSIFHFANFEKTPYINENAQIFQWLLECASKLTFPFHAKDLADFAIECYNAYMEYVKQE